VSYTRVPGRVRHQPHLDVDAHVSFFPLLEIVSPVDPTDSPGDGSIMAASPLGVRLVPDVHMSCFDFLYFVSAGTQEYEWKNRWAPAWRFRTAPQVYGFSHATRHSIRPEGAHGNLRRPTTSECGARLLSAVVTKAYQVVHYGACAPR